MTYSPIRFLFTLLGSLFPIISIFCQDDGIKVQKKEGPVFKQARALMQVRGIGYDERYFYTLRKEQEKRDFVKYNKKSLSRIDEKDIPLGNFFKSAEFKYYKVLREKESIIFLGVKKGDDENVLMAKKLNKKTLEVGESGKEIARMEKLEKVMWNEIVDEINCTYSPDSSEIVVRRYIYPVRDVEEKKSRVSVWNLDANDLEVNWKKSFKLPLPSKVISWRNDMVDQEGNFYFQIRAISDDVRDKGGGGAYYLFGIKKGEGEMLSTRIKNERSGSHFIGNFLWDVGPNGHLYGVGQYSSMANFGGEDVAGSARGLIFLEYDNELEEVENEAMELEDAFILKNEPDPIAEKMKEVKEDNDFAEPELFYYSPIKLHRMGNRLILEMEYYEDRYYTGNLLFVCFDETGEILWKKKAPKFQETSIYDGQANFYYEMNRYARFRENGHYYYLYNHNPNYGDLDDDGRELVLMRFDKQGEMAKTTIDIKEEDAFLGTRTFVPKPKTLAPIGDGEYVFPATSKYKTKMIKIKAVE